MLTMEVRVHICIMSVSLSLTIAHFITNLHPFIVIPSITTAIDIIVDHCIRSRLAADWRRGMSVYTCMYIHTLVVLVMIMAIMWCYNHINMYLHDYHSHSCIDSFSFSLLLSVRMLALPFMYAVHVCAYIYSWMYVFSHDIHMCLCVYAYLSASLHWFSWVRTCIHFNSYSRFWLRSSYSTVTAVQ